MSDFAKNLIEKYPTAVLLGMFLSGGGSGLLTHLVADEGVSADMIAELRESVATLQANQVSIRRDLERWYEEDRLITPAEIRELLER